MLRETVRACLDHHGVPDIRFGVTVARDLGRPQIQVTIERPLPSAVTHAAAVRALAAVRGMDRSAPPSG
jgi:hypothetical protein